MVDTPRKKAKDDEQAQIGEEVITGATEDAESESKVEAQVRADALAAKRVLDAEEKVPLFIPQDQLNPNQQFVDVWINGYHYKIERGKMVHVPKSVASLFPEGRYIYSSSQLDPYRYGKGCAPV